MRLIDADKVVSEIQKMRFANPIRHTGHIYNEGLYDAINAIDNAETVDAEPVRHGRWVPTEFDGYADGYPVWDTWECSECRDEQYGNDIADLLHYCPNCGAKMDEAPRKKEETE